MRKKARAKAERIRLEDVRWNATKDSTDADTFKAFLKDWPTGAHATEARRLQRALEDGDSSQRIMSWVLGSFLLMISVLIFFVANRDTLFVFMMDSSIRTFKGHSDDVNSVAFSPDGRFALSGSRDDTLRLWDVKTGHELRSFKGHSRYVNSVAFSPDGRFALSGSDDHTLRLWDVKTGHELRSFKGHSNYVKSVAFSPDGRFALSGGSHFTLKLWDVKTGRELLTFKGHSGSVYTVVFSPDGRFALSGSWDNTLKLWDISVKYRKNDWLQAFKSSHM